MKLFLLFLIIVCIYIPAEGYDFVAGKIGERSDESAFMELVKYDAIPYFKRERDYFFRDVYNKTIEGIRAQDNYNSQSTVTITSGGIGYTYVNLLLTSEPGKGLSYYIEFYNEDEDNE